MVMDQPLGCTITCVPSTHLYMKGQSQLGTSWTADPKIRHVHIDTNTTGAALVFCAMSIKGGELVVKHSYLRSQKFISGDCGCVGSPLQQ